MKGKGGGGGEKKSYETETYAAVSSLIRSKCVVNTERHAADWAGCKSR